MRGVVSRARHEAEVYVAVRRASRGASRITFVRPLFLEYSVWVSQKAAREESGRGFSTTSLGGNLNTVSGLKPEEGTPTVELYTPPRVGETAHPCSVVDCKISTGDLHFSINQVYLTRTLAVAQFHSSLCVLRCEGPTHRHARVQKTPSLFGRVCAQVTRVKGAHAERNRESEGAEGGRRRLGTHTNERGARKLTEDRRTTPARGGIGKGCSS